MDSQVPETFIIQKEMSISTLKGEAEAITTATTIITTDIKTEARVLITEAISTKTEALDLTTEI